VLVVADDPFVGNRIAGPWLVVLVAHRKA